MKKAFKKVFVSLFKLVLSAQQGHKIWVQADRNRGSQRDERHRSTSYPGVFLDILNELSNIIYSTMRNETTKP